MHRLRSLVCAGLLLLATAASAGEATQRLEAFTTGLESFTAGFVQTVYDEDQRPVQESHGQAWLQRPGLFRWEYETPYQQTIVADGERLWIHDEDLEQVTVKKVERALGTAPIMLLSNSEPLSEQFEILDRGRREDLYWVELQPKVDDTDFRRIFLGFDEQALKVMELRDRFDQATQIRFHHVRLNPDIEAAKFEFTPPEGADVLRGAPDAAGDGD
ncbi:MAG: outer membrane lipoprotein chaperone LolA [Halofilum sp. (in: g-proteobacteria)]|nr:outer membrane lipoprotein chaperone LolA [Halofilum sp. (in: g-proteobacteria)]